MIQNPQKYFSITTCIHLEQKKIRRQREVVCSIASCELIVLAIMCMQRMLVHKSNT